MQRQEERIVFEKYLLPSSNFQPVITYEKKFVVTNWNYYLVVKKSTGIRFLNFLCLNLWLKTMQILNDLKSSHTEEIETFRKSAWRRYVCCWRNSNLKLKENKLPQKCCMFYKKKPEGINPSGAPLLNYFGLSTNWSIRYHPKYSWKYLYEIYLHQVNLTEGGTYK